MPTLQGITDIWHIQGSVRWGLIRSACQEVLEPGHTARVYSGEAGGGGEDFDSMTACQDIFF